MNILLAIDSRKNVAVDSLPAISKYLGEHVRRQLNCELSIVDLAKRQVLNTAKYDAVIIATELWRGSVGDHTVQLLQRVGEQKRRVIIVQSYLSEEDFIRALPAAIPAQILEESLTFQLGMNVDPKLLNPLEKLWWGVTRQRVETQYDRKQIRSIISRSLKALETKQ